MIIIWVLAAIGAALAFAAARAYWIERREGLRRSTRRAAAAAALALALIGLGVLAPTDDAAPAPAPQPAAPEPAPERPAIAPRAPEAAPPPRSSPPTRAPDPAARARISGIEQQIRSLEAQLDKLRASLAELEAAPPPKSAADAAVAAATPPAEPPPETAAARAPAPSTTRPEPSAPPRPAAPSGERSLWLLYAAIALVIAAFGVMLLGDPSTLLPGRRRKRAQASAAGVEEVPDLARLVSHALAARWKEGLAVAEQIQIERLAKLEVLDFLYVRALCSAMAASTPEGPGAKLPSHEERTKRLTAASEDLVRLLELAPNMAEATWLHGHVKARLGQWQLGLDLMRQARPDLDPDPRFDHDESVCLLELANDRLERADNDGATRLFDEVSKLGVLARQVPLAMVTHRALAVRAQIKSNELAEATAGIARIREIEGLDEAAQRTTSMACSIYEIAILYRSGRLEEALRACTAFLERWQPAKLPPVEDQVADEFLHPAVDRAALALSPDLYRALYFLGAVIRVELASRRGQPLDPETVDAVAIALLRSLQFQPRHRDSLAALAALYLVHRPARTEQALAWLDAALALGVRSAKVRALLLEARRAERDRKELLALFRSASAKFLSDPALGAQVRGVLLEELGRFDEFRPVIVDLQSEGAIDPAAPGEVTLEGLRERAAFVAGVAAEAAARSELAAASTLAALHQELAALTASVDTSAVRIAAIEQAVMQQLGNLVLR
jgi:hypothetical protein